MKFNYEEFDKLLKYKTFRFKKTLKEAVENHENLHFWLFEAFVWDKTKEGDSFWRELCMSLKPIEYNKDPFQSQYNIMLEYLKNTKYVIEKPKCYEI